MLIKNRKTGVLFRATPRLVALAVRDAHYELLDDGIPVDMDEVKTKLAVEKGGADLGVLEDIKKYEPDKPKAKKKATKKKVAKKAKTDEFTAIEQEVIALQGGDKDKDHKDRLEAMALETFGVDLDKRRSLADLKQDVLDLIAEHRE